MMLYKNTKLKVLSLDGDTDFFDIVTGVLEGDTLTPYLFNICLNYVLRMTLRWQRHEAEDTPDKLLRTRTTLMT